MADWLDDYKPATKAKTSDWLDDYKPTAADYENAPKPLPADEKESALSPFGPSRNERLYGIPGMEDVQPEDDRWLIQRTVDTEKALKAFLYKNLYRAPSVM